MYKIVLEELDTLYSLIRESEELYLLEETNKSPKELFFPQSETLYTCKKDGKNITIEPEELASKDFVVFGIKACDIKAIEVLDRVYLVEPVDSFYASRRERATLVSLTCNEPDETCFCKVFGIDATEPEGDVSTWAIGEMLYWRANTKKGEQLTEKVQSLLSEVTSEDEKTIKEHKEKVVEIMERLPYRNLLLEGWDGEHLTEKFESEHWEKLHKACLACGTCTYVCPTCQCYDIKDYNTGREVERYRCWDSCMYSDFTMMAHGNNRTTQMQRFRQRFMHKLVYFPVNNDGVYSCVGCGRCVAKCPSSLNIVKVIKAFEDKGGNPE